jgi:membrane dipeptidase
VTFPWRRARAAEVAAAHGLTESQLHDGRALLLRVPSVDIHGHPGRFFLQGAAPTSLSAGMQPPSAGAAIADMRAGPVSAVLFAGVADQPVLESAPNGLRSARAYRPGEAYDEYRRQLQLLQALVKGGTVLPGLTAADIERAFRRGRTACVFSMEGGDFLEDRLQRVGAAYRAGVRAVTILHYHPNGLGDAQGLPPVHGGLSAMGRRVVREMNRTGILVDLSHAGEAATRDAVDVATRPMLLSHSNLQAPGLDHPRLVSLAHAQLVTRAGGVIGALPAGAGQTSLAAYADGILGMVDRLGVDHVAIGTDMDFTFRSVLSGYRDWSLVPAALLARGMHETEVARIVGGNFLRVFRAAEQH